jgi:hypothetical protein
VFSSQEWCGQSYAGVLFDPGRLRITSHSYFAGEAGERSTLDVPSGGVAEEQLFFWARGMAAPVVAPGQSVTVPFLPSLQSSRHSHKPLAWGRARRTRRSGSTEVSVPAGTYRVEVFQAEVEGGPSRTFWVESDAPHRLIQWESSTGERARLLGVDRMKYWQMNQPGGEEALKRLGVSPRPPRTT